MHTKIKRYKLSKPLIYFQKATMIFFVLISVSLALSHHHLHRQPDKYVGANVADPGGVRVILENF